MVSPTLLKNNLLWYYAYGSALERHWQVSVQRQKQNWWPVGESLKGSLIAWCLGIQKHKMRHRVQSEDMKNRDKGVKIEESRLTI